MNRLYTLIVILLTLGSLIHSVNAQDASIWMPDANLRNAVREDLGLANDEALTQDKMLDLTSLHAPQEGISDLTGLEHATNLTKLVAWQNQISNLSPFQNLTKLTEIRIGGNQISNITPLGGLTHLTRLGLQRNNISNISALANLAQLEWLRLVGNPIADAYLLASLANLTDVDIDIPPPPDTEAPGVSISVPSGVQADAFDVSVTFTESVSEFTQSELSLSGTASASITAWSANSDNMTYTATITPTSSGSVTLNVNAGVATDAADNPNTAATSQTVTVSVDAESPGVSISVPSGVQNSAFNVAITFTEAVSEFTQSDLSLSGTASASITAWNTAGNTTYTATITPTSSGTVTLGVAAGVATDAANNQNTAATSKTVTVDADRPTVTIGVPSGTQTGTFDATIMFSETVSGFVGSDVSLTGSAASITGWSANIDNTVYTATITPTASGTVTIGVVANVATDGANNQNTAATPKTVTVSVDTDAPGVSISVPSGVQNGAFNATITFTESVSRFVQSDLSLSGTASASVTSWSANSDNTTYTATITPTSSGTVTLGVAAGVATDAANNQNTAATAQTVTVDVDKPTVTISLPSGTQTSTFNAIITFSEAVSGFGQSDVFLTGSEASITSWSANSGDTVYTATITPTASGTVTVGVAADVATDGANNQNTAATPKTVTVSVDTDAPGVSVSVPSGVQNGAFNATITFTESVSGFTQSKLSLTGTVNASITAWQTTDNTTYTATITPTSSGTVTLNVSASVATDAANNQNTAATAQTVTVDVDKPTVTISLPSGTQTSTFNAIITFSEAVSGFGQSDVFLTGSEASITSWSANSGDTVYTATITPTASGTVTVSVAANVAADAANNSNTGATSQTVTVDVDRPTVTIGVPSGTQTGTFDATIMFSETVSGFVSSDVSLTGSAASITAWNANTDNTVYTATITPTASGTVTVGVDANVATDAANNQNTAAISQMVTVDVDRPTVSISVPSDVQNSAFDVTITFSEAVSDFEQSDMSLTGTATASITAWSANTENTVYTATIIPTTSGTATLSVAAGVATDIASNPNTAATPRTVTIAMPALVQDLTTWMPDANLRNAVRKALKLASDETFSQEDMQSLTRLSVLNRIMDLTGLEHATQLTTLDVMYSDISDISPLAGLTFLTTLDLRGNNISDVTPLAKLVNLEKLWLSDNPITDISPLAGLTALRWLVIMDANVSNVTPLAKLVNLEQLLLAGNSITDFSPLSNLNNLQYADVEIPEPEPEPLEVSISVPSGVQNSAFNATITFTEAVSDFTQSDLSLSGTATASITVWQTTDNTTYTATITPTTSGTVTLSVAANVATDAANNPNTAATAKTVTVDVDKPRVTIGVPSGVQNGAFNVTISFTEAVSGFVQSELSLTGTASASVTAWNTNDNTTYTATVTPTTSGTVTLNVPAGVAKDAANNANTAATSQTVTVDVDAPSVSISVPSGDQTDAFDVTITFSESVSDFTQSDVSVSGTANASITAWSISNNTTYTATITPSTSGTVSLIVPDNVATDAANNANIASGTETITVFVIASQVVDTTSPSVSITVPDGAQNSAFEVTITFTEAVSGFVQSELSLGGTASASITAWSANADDTVYTATVTPTSSGDVIFSIANAVATDAANNPNTAATSQTVTVDVDVPTVSISVPSGIQNSAFDATITFSKPVSDFVQADVSLTGTASASITAWSANTDNTVYTATITPTTSGTVILDIAAGVATDAANNPNTALATQTVIVDVGPPSVTITVPEGVQNRTINAIITFSEPVSGFGPTDISLEGTAPSNIYGFGVDIMTVSEDLTTWRFSVYSVKIVAFTTGTVQIQVPAGAATDVDGNPNTASEKLTVIVYPNWDVNEDGVVDDTDVGLVTAALGQSGDAIENPRTDVNGDGTVDAADEQIVRQYHKDTARLIPDANLAAAIRDELELAEHAEITAENMQSLNRLWVDWEGVTDLTGLEHATNLSDLDLRGNSISDPTPLKGLTNLSDLSLSGNSISDLTPLKGLTNLRYLYLSGNSISNLTPLTGLTNLTSLNLGNNSISDLTSLAGLTNLASLNLGNNSISDLTFLAGLTNLNFLYLGNNSISDLTPLKGLTDLIHLRLDDNSISDLTPLTGLTSLTSLYLEGNSIVDTSPLYPLTQGSLANLDIHVYPAWDVNEDRVVDATDSALVTAALGQTGEGIVNPRTDVNRDGTVDAADQQSVTDNIDQIVAVPDANLAAQIRHRLGLSTTASISTRVMLDLEELEASSASISNLTGLEHATNLEKLILESNSINDISAVANLTNLTRLDLSRNSISDIGALANLTNLTWLELDRISISDISVLGSLSRLMTLFLRDNLIQDISVLGSLSRLTTLILSNNNISDISVLGSLSGLTTLSLSNNNISDISVLGSLSRLRALYLRDNLIQDISVLGSLSGLTTLSLSDNNISDISVLGSLSRLRALYLRDNLIQDISVLGSLSGLTTLYLRNNLIQDTSPLYPLLEVNGGKLEVDITVSQYPPWDVNEDGVVDDTDSALVTAALGQSGDDIVNPRTDVNSDGTVDNDDLTLVTDNLDNADPIAPSSSGLFTLLDQETLEKLDPATLEAQLDILRAESDGSLKYLRAIVLLESLLAALRPSETRMLANYPNPFNPETWIPYQLASDTDVQFSIYDINGALVRQLDLGYQRAGYYTNRSRAAYWDGRNRFGERVVTGIYFYQLQTDTMSFIRKMLILK